MAPVFILYFMRINATTTKRRSWSENYTIIINLNFIKLSLLLRNFQHANTAVSSCTLTLESQVLRERKRLYRRGAARYGCTCRLIHRFFYTLAKIQTIKASCTHMTNMRFFQFPGWLPLMLIASPVAAARNRVPRILSYLSLSCSAGTCWTEP